MDVHTDGDVAQATGANLRAMYRIWWRAHAQDPRTIYTNPRQSFLQLRPALTSFIAWYTSHEGDPESLYQQDPYDVYRALNPPL